MADDGNPFIQRRLCVSLFRTQHECRFIVIIILQSICWQNCKKTRHEVLVEREHLAVRFSENTLSLPSRATVWAQGHMRSFVGVKQKKKTIVLAWSEEVCPHTSSSSSCRLPCIEDTCIAAAPGSKALNLYKESNNLLGIKYKMSYCEFLSNLVYECFGSISPMLWRKGIQEHIFVLSQHSYFLPLQTKYFEIWMLLSVYWIVKT